MVLLPSLVVAFIFIIGCYLNRAYLFEVGRGLKSVKAFTPQYQLRPRHEIEILPASSGARLEGSALKHAMDGLSRFVEQVKPEWIVGIHPGGRLLSVAIADRLSLPAHRCIYIRTNKGTEVQFVPPVNQPLEGSLMIIDDISRTGRTLNRVKWELFSKNYANDQYQISKVSIAVLAVEWKPEAPDATFRPDWASFRTDLPYLKFPWSDLTARIGVALSRMHAQEPYDEELMAYYFHLIEDFEFALAVTRQYLPPIIATGTSF